MRGDVRIKDDKAVTDEDVESYHLILFGDESSNKWTNKIAPLLLRAGRGLRWSR